MDRHSGVEIRLLGSHFHGDPQELRHLAGVVAENMDAEHSVRLTIDDDLHEGLFGPARHIRLQRPKTRRVNIDAGKIRAGLGFR